MFNRHLNTPLISVKAMLLIKILVIVLAKIPSSEHCNYIKSKPLLIEIQCKTYSCRRNRYLVAEPMTNSPQLFVMRFDLNIIVSKKNP